MRPTCHPHPWSTRALVYVGLKIDVIRHVREAMSLLDPFLGRSDVHGTQRRVAACAEFKRSEKLRIKLEEINFGIVLYIFGLLLAGEIAIPFVHVAQRI